MADSTTRKLQCIVVTPEATVLDQSARFVALPLYDGELGIYPGRAPLIGRLGYGEMRILTGEATGPFEDKPIRYYVDGGFVQVADNVVSVLTNQAIPAADLDEEVLQEQLSEAREKPSNSEELMAIRDRNISQARGKLQVARRAK